MATIILIIIGALFVGVLLYSAYEIINIQSV
jgi:hypothetical protein